MAASASIIETSLLLCEVIEDWQLTNAHNNDGRLDWDAITLKMVDKTGKPVQRSDLQTVWKYIAYGKRKIRPEGNGEAITYSDDEEPFHQPFSAVKRHKTHTAIQLQKMEAIKKGGTLSPELIAQRHILASTIPEAMRSDLLCRKIQVMRFVISLFCVMVGFYYNTNFLQINIPDHVRLGFVGIQPPIYVPSSEMTLATK